MKFLCGLENVNLRYADKRWKSAVNMVNPLGTKGRIAAAFAALLGEMGKGDVAFIMPSHFRVRHFVIEP